MMSLFLLFSVNCREGTLLTSQSEINTVNEILQGPRWTDGEVHFVPRKCTTLLNSEECALSENNNNNNK